MTMTHARVLAICFTLTAALVMVIPSGLCADTVTWVEIHDLDDLDDIRNDLDGNYRLMADIDASPTTEWRSGMGWSSIGTYHDPFTGTLDGNGHVIAGLTVNVTEFTPGDPWSAQTGLFGVTGGGNTISNLAVVNASITAQASTGIIIGEVKADGQGTQLLNSFVSGTVIGSEMVGGLVGWYQKGTVQNCFSLADVGNYGAQSIHSNMAFGMVNHLNTVVTNVYAAGEYIGHPDAYSSGSLTSHTSGSPQVYSSYYNSDLASPTIFSATGQPAQYQTGTPKTTAQMRQQSTFTNWDFSSIWEIEQGVSFPNLRTFPLTAGPPPNGDDEPQNGDDPPGGDDPPNGDDPGGPVQVVEESLLAGIDSLYGVFLLALSVTLIMVTYYYRHPALIGITLIVAAYTVLKVIGGI